VAGIRLDGPSGNRPPKHMTIGPAVGLARCRIYCIYLGLGFGMREQTTESTGPESQDVFEDELSC
jgi:hypothetical protein